MNILFTTHQGELAGSTFSIYYLVRGLAEKYHRVHVACRSGVLLWRKLESIPNVILHDLSIRSYSDLNACCQIKDIVKEERIDLINAQGGKDRNLVIITKWLFGLNVKIVFTRRQRPRNEPWIKRWFHSRGVDKIVMISHGLKEIFIARGYRASNLHVIHNAVPASIVNVIDEDRVEQLRNQLGLVDQVVVGCLSRKKSQEQLLEAFLHLPHNYVGLFVGIDKEEVDQSLLAKVPQRMHFSGIIPHDEALHYLKLMTVNVLPSYLDGFGLVLVESMLLGVPVIGSDFGGIPDVIQDGKNGLLFENGKPEELASKILQFLNDEDFRQTAISQGANDARERFSVERMVNEYERLFQSLLI